MGISGFINVRSPIIGITTYSRNEASEFTLPAAYIDAVQLAGGIPLLLPPLQNNPTPLLDRLDGLIFAGGGDISPSLYQGEHHPTIYLVDEERDYFELALAKAVLVRSLPTLGICRGMQLLAVASGARLIPHLPEVYGEVVTHRLDHPRRPTEHSVQIRPESRLRQILGIAETTIVSWHHQAVSALPAPWHIAATAPDGLIEAIEFSLHPWLIAVQWHPELSPAATPQHQLFRALVEAAASSPFRLN